MGRIIVDRLPNMIERCPFDHICNSADGLTCPMSLESDNDGACDMFIELPTALKEDDELRKELIELIQK